MAGFFEVVVLVSIAGILAAAGGLSLVYCLLMMVLSAVVLAVVVLAAVVLAAVAGVAVVACLLLYWLLASSSFGSVWLELQLL